MHQQFSTIILLAQDPVAGVRRAATGAQCTGQLRRNTASPVLHGGKLGRTKKMALIIDVEDGGGQRDIIIS